MRGLIAWAVLLATTATCSTESIPIEHHPDGPPTRGGDVAADAAGPPGDTSAGRSTGTDDAGVAALDADLPPAADGRQAAADASERPDSAPAPPDGGAAGSDAPHDPGAPYDPCPPKGKACAILPLGDSITTGVGYPGGGGYRVELFLQAVRHGKALTFVGSGSNGPQTVAGVPFPRAHEGHSGYSIGRLSTTLAENDAIARYHPDIVLMHVGTHDVTLPRDIDASLRRMGDLIDQIQAHDPHVLVLVGTIILSRSKPLNDGAVLFNAGLPALVEARAAAGRHIALVDVAAKFTANPDYQTEYLGSKVHPNAAGYDVMGDAWYEALAPLLH